MLYLCVGDLGLSQCLGQTKDFLNWYWLLFRKGHRNKHTEEILAQLIVKITCSVVVTSPLQADELAL